MHLDRKFATRAAFGATSYFLGVSATSKKDFRLAVRLQDHALEKSELVQEITARARGEVDVRYVGRIRTRALWYRSRNRPMLMGSSVGYLATGYVMAGTLGAFVHKADPSALYILSNNHVLADENRYKIGRAIVQPGALDGGSAASDRVAKLSAFVKLDSNATNFVDCAKAKVNSGIAANVGTLKGLGKLAGVASGGLGVHDKVHKVGRTTGLRHGRVKG